MVISDVSLARLPLDWLCRVGGSGGIEPWEVSILHMAWCQAVAPPSETPESWLVRGCAGGVAEGGDGPGPLSHGRVLWAVTEVSPRWPGYFEGAIEAGEIAAAAVLARWRSALGLGRRGGAG